MTQPTTTPMQTSFFSITKTHWLPKIAIATIPIIGIFVGAYLESRVRQESSPSDPFTLQATSLRHQNHYKIGIIANNLICIAGLITFVALNIITPWGGICGALYFGTLATIAVRLLLRDISYIKDLNNGISPWKLNS